MERSFYGLEQAAVKALFSIIMLQFYFCLFPINRKLVSSYLKQISAQLNLPEWMQQNRWEAEKYWLFIHDEFELLSQIHVYFCTKFFNQIIVSIENCTFRKHIWVLLCWFCQISCNELLKNAMQINDIWVFSFTL